MSNNAERLTLVEKLALVQSRARIMGFRRHDLEDAVQEVMLSVLEFQYDPEQPNGGTETTALTTVIDRQLVSLKRVRRRHTKIAQWATDELAARCQGFKDGPCIEDDSAAQRLASEGVASIIATMDDDMQQVCRLLMDGRSENAIAEQLGMGWQRVARLVSRIRERLETAGYTAADAE
jgi:RNA polymerase sigma factor (sigma-70 family)